MTCTDVRRWLTAVFLLLPSSPVFSVRVGTVEPLGDHTAPRPFDWLAFSADVLGAKSRERLWLLTWARCAAIRQARKRRGLVAPAGGSVGDFCREFGVERATFDRTVARACDRLAEAWNARDFPS